MIIYTLHILGRKIGIDYKLIISFLCHELYDNIHTTMINFIKKIFYVLSNHVWPIIVAKL